MFLSAGALDHGGPGRLWVTLARRFASAGVRSVRVDFDGIGETFGRPGQPRNIPKPPEAIDDLCDLVATLGDVDAADLVLVGLSSGGYHAIEGGLRFHPSGVAAINPGLASWVPEIEEGRVDSRRRAYRPMPAALRKVAVKHGRSARWLWRATLQVWVNRSPNWPVAEVARRGIPMLIIVNEHDSVQFEPSLYWSLVRRRLRRRGLLTVDRVPGSDHSLYTPGGMERGDSDPHRLGALSLWKRPPQVGPPTGVVGRSSDVVGEAPLHLFEDDRADQEHRHRNHDREHDLPEGWRGEIEERPAEVGEQPGEGVHVEEESGTSGGPRNRPDSRRAGSAGRRARCTRCRGSGPAARRSPVRTPTRTG